MNSWVHPEAKVRKTVRATTMPYTTQQPRRPPKLPLTFGLEVTLFTALKGYTFDRIPEGTITHLLVERLRQHRLSGPQGCGSKICAAVGRLDSLPIPDLVDYAGWTLTSTPSASADRPEWFKTYATESVEIISPPYHMDSLYWERDLQRVFSLRPGQYNVIPTWELRLYCEQNNSTTMHMHIGNGLDPDSGFPFETIRNLVMILLVYEPLLDGLPNGMLYPAAIPVDPPRCVSPVDNPHFLTPELASRPARALLALHILKTCPGVISLINAMNPNLPNMVDAHGPRYFKYNFVPLLDSVDGTNPYDESGAERLSIGPVKPKRKSPTIEFRHHIGTLDPDTMTSWVKLMGAIVELAGRLTTETMVDFLDLDKWVLCDVEEEGGEEGNLRKEEADHESSTDKPSEGPRRQHYARLSKSEPPSAFSLLLAPYPVGSFFRLCEALESAQIPLDDETFRFWRRKG